MAEYNIDKIGPLTGRKIKEDGTIVNTADKIEDIANAVKGSASLIQGNVTITGLAQQLASAACKNITVQAEPTNGNLVYIGMSNAVSSSVHMATLGPGSSMTFTVSNANMLWVIGTSGDKICYGGEA
ncbi:hypothetical protein [Petroclostridium sp. X23]|uniref:hypothetical protein n=1 Tax=Petroclostridium sp. X23 TaxID=3045146 RepID=UPI0024ADB17C|nr:hypothetical protein [Petroclostridium sp. X23]WHH58475.1 hypothetical protein QKW49_22180 [Petroclostridium sp. X23]